MYEAPDRGYWEELESYLPQARRLLVPLMCLEFRLPSRVGVSPWSNPRKPPTVFG